MACAVDSLIRVCSRSRCIGIPHTLHVVPRRRAWPSDHGCQCKVELLSAEHRTENPGVDGEGGRETSRTETIWRCRGQQDETGGRLALLAAVAGLGVHVGIAAAGERLIVGGNDPAGYMWVPAVVGPVTALVGGLVAGAIVGKCGGGRWRKRGLALVSPGVWTGAAAIGAGLISLAAPDADIMGPDGNRAVWDCAGGGGVSRGCGGARLWRT